MYPAINTTAVLDAAVETLLSYDYSTMMAFKDMNIFHLIFELVEDVRYLTDLADALQTQFLAWVIHFFVPYSQYLVVGGLRPVRVVIPNNYDSTVPAPLLIGVHGYSNTAEYFDNYFKIGPSAMKRGVVYASINGYQNVEGLRFWNATDACCDFYGTGVDDAAYIMSLIDEISSKISIDQRMIYLVGHSNGNFMGFNFACRYSERLAGFMGLAGAMYKDFSKCNATHPVNMLHIHGTNDKTIAYDGGFIFFDEYPSA